MLSVANEPSMVFRSSHGSSHFTDEETHWLRKVWRIIQGTIKQAAEPVPEDRLWDCRLLITMLHNLLKTKSPKRVDGMVKPKGKNVPGKKERKGSVQYDREVKQEVKVKGSTGLRNEEVFDGGKSLTGEHQTSQL